MKKAFREIIGIFGNNWSSAVALNGLLFPFLLPLAVWLIICQCYSSILIHIEGVLDGWYVVTFLGLLPTILIFFLGLSGYFTANKKIFYEENGAVWSTFKEGFKKNWARYLLYGLICWAPLVVAVVLPVMYLRLNIPPVLCGVCVAVCVIQVVVLVPMTVICMTENVFFEDTLKNVFGNAFKILLLQPLTIVFCLIAVLPIFIAVILPFIWQLSVWVLVAFVFSTVSVTFITVRLGNIFCDVINKN